MTTALMLLRYILEEAKTFLISLWDYIYSWLEYLWYTVTGKRRGAATGQVIVFDNGRRVRILRQIAEGGYSIIFSARDCTPAAMSSNESNRTTITATMGGNTTDATSTSLFALKRMLCPDDETVRKCREEAAVHRSLGRHDNLMPLLGLKFEDEVTCGEYRGTVCYMLFPLLRSSLRDQITERELLSTDIPKKVRPWKEREILEIFAGVVDGVRSMHECGYAHRDVKLENVLMDEGGIPVLMDFGSVGPVDVPIRTRSNLMRVVDEASTNSTVSYRAPELFEGEARHGEYEDDIDFGRVDVWSLGCVLFGMMYGASPFECEFRGDCVRIVECSHLRVLGRVPTPPPNTELASRYTHDLFDFVLWMLVQDRAERPTIAQVSARTDEILDRCGGMRRGRRGGSSSTKEENDLDGLLASSSPV